MDPRLKKVMTDTASRKRVAEKVAAELKAEENKKADKLLKKNKAAAKAWIEKNLFNLIEEEELKNLSYVEFNDHSWNKGDPSYAGIPASLLANEASKIDGLRIEERWATGYNDPDMGSEPDHWVYQVWWKPKPYGDYR